MQELLQTLLELQSIEFSETEIENGDARAAELRGKIPPQILSHYERLVARGKKGVAAVRHQTCMACHVAVPLGTVITLRRGDDIALCGNCGRYLWLDETPDPAPEPKKKIRRKKSTQLILA